MMWVFLAFLTAFFTSLKDISGRKAVEKAHPLIIAWAWTAFSLPFLVAYIFWKGVPAVQSGFWPAAAVSTAVLSISSILYFRAMSVSDLSLCVPMLAFTPLFLLITSPLILGEFPNIYGLIGIILIVVGSYVLNFNSRKVGFFEPFMRLLRDPGPRYVLIVAVLFSIGANVDKIGVRASSPGFWMLTINSLVTAVLTVVMLKWVDKPFKQILRVLPFLILMGMAMGVAVLAQMHAIQMTIVPYVIAIKRTSVAFTAVFGFWLFREKNWRERLIGIILMVLGVFCISFLAE
ncbi:MAG: EamA family transporter [Candidatus Omnitrophota bacterium]